MPTWNQFVLGKIVCVVLLKKGCVKLNGTLLSKCIYIQNLMMLNGTLQDKYGVLLAYDSLVQLLRFYVTLCVYWFFFILVGHMYPGDLEGIPNHQVSSLK